MSATLDAVFGAIEHTAIGASKSIDTVAQIAPTLIAKACKLTDVSLDIAIHSVEDKAVSAQVNADLKDWLSNLPV